MEIRRATFGAAIRWGCVLSVVGTIVALVAASIGDVNATTMALIVAVVGFCTSWSLTTRTLRTAPAGPRHRVTVLSVRHPVG